MKKLIACILAAAALMTLLPTAFAEEISPAQRLINAGLVDCGITDFRPDDKITVAEAAVILGRIVKYDGLLDRSFTDIDRNTEAGDSILRLAAAGILYVPSEGSLCYPQGYISRQDAVAMLYKLFKVSPQDKKPGWTDYGYIKNTDAVNAFYSLGYIPERMQQGNAFAPNMAITRYEFAEILCRVVACFADSEGHSGTVQGNAVAKKAGAVAATGIVYVTEDTGTSTADTVYLKAKWSPTNVKLANYTKNIGTFTTEFPAGESGRNTNIKQAADYINGKILAPGESFSFNEAVGARSYARGFRNATIYVGDQHVQGLGGGICQVSSTLFVAALNAGMTITERHQHSMPVSYVDKGLDATVSYGVLDMRFTNNLSVPVKITTSTSKENGTIKVDIWTVEDYNKPKTKVGASYKKGKYYGYRYINGKLDYYTVSRY